MKTWSSLKRVFLYSLILILAGCFTFEHIDQPQTVTTGESFRVTAEVKVFKDPFWGLDKSGHYAIIGMMIPLDWTVDSVYYEPGDPGDIGPNVCAYLHPDSADSETGGQVDYWTDSLNVHFPPPEGMHWVVYQSLTRDSTVLDTGYVHVFMEFTAGVNTGTFDLGYFVSNAALDFSDPNWYEESLGNTIEVLANQPPVIEALPGLGFDEDDSLRYAVADWYDYVSDEDPDSLLEFMVLNGAFVTGMAVEDSIRFKAPENWWGEDTVHLVVSDSRGLRDTSGIAVTVNSVNDIPVLMLPDSISFSNDDSYSLNLWQSVDDVENGGSTMTWTIGTGTESLVTALEDGTGWLTLSAPEYSGTTWLYVQVEDPHGGTDQDTVDVVVEDATAIDWQNTGSIPDAYLLNQNYPNPFNPLTAIRFGIPESGTVLFEVYNLLGQRIYRQDLGFMPAGFHEITFDAAGMVSGIYYYKIEANGFTGLKKMAVIK